MGSGCVDFRLFASMVVSLALSEAIRPRVSAASLRADKALDGFASLGSRPRTVDLVEYVLEARGLSRPFRAGGDGEATVEGGRIPTGKPEGEWPARA